MKYEKSCGAVVLNGDTVLVVKHRAGHVDFPKGHVEGNETEEETAIREVKEETNIDISIVGYRATVHYSPTPGVEKEVVFFLANRISGEIIPQLSEVTEVKWIPISEVEKTLTYHSAIDLFKEIVKGKEKESEK